MITQLVCRYQILSFFVSKAWYLDTVSSTNGMCDFVDSDTCSNIDLLPKCPSIRADFLNFRLKCPSIPDAFLKFRSWRGKGNFSQTYPLGEVIEKIGGLERLQAKVRLLLALAPKSPG